MVEVSTSFTTKLVDPFTLNKKILILHKVLDPEPIINTNATVQPIFNTTEICQDANWTL